MKTLIASLAAAALIATPAVGQTAKASKPVAKEAKAESESPKTEAKEHKAAARHHHAAKCGCPSKYAKHKGKAHKAKAKKAASDTTKS